MQKLKKEVHVHNTIKTLHNMQLQKEVKPNPKIHLYKKCVAPQECCCEKRFEIQSGHQEMAVHDGRLFKAKFLITTIQVNLVPKRKENVT